MAARRPTRLVGGGRGAYSSRTYSAGVEQAPPGGAHERPGACGPSLRGQSVPCVRPRVYCPAHALLSLFSLSLSRSCASLLPLLRRPTMSRYHPLAAPSFLGLPPLPTPPPDALGLLDAELLPESLPPPPRRSRLRQASSSADEDDGAYPPVPPRVTAGVRPTRSDSRASDPRERNRSKAPGSDWESDDEPQARERPAGELVVLSRHPALVKVRAGAALDLSHSLSLNR